MSKEVARIMVGGVELAVVEGAVIRCRDSGEVLIVGEVGEEDVARVLLGGRRLQVEKAPETSLPSIEDGGRSGG